MVGKMSSTILYELPQPRFHSDNITLDFNRPVIHKDPIRYRPVGVQVHYVLICHIFPETLIILRINVNHFDEVIETFLYQFGNLYMVRSFQAIYQLTIEN